MRSDVQEMGVKIGISMAIAVVLAVFTSAIRFSYLDAFFLDLRNYLTAPQFQRDDIVSIDFSELKNQKEDLSSHDLINAIKKISLWKPQLILLSLKPGEIREVSALDSLINNEPLLYLYSKWGDDGSFAYSIHKDNSKSLVLKHTIDGSLPPFDFKTRRFVLSMAPNGYDLDLLKFNSAIHMFNEQEEFDAVLKIYDTKQINLRYYRQDSLPEIKLSRVRSSDVESKIVIITTNDNHSPNVKPPYVRFSYDEESSVKDYFSLGSYLLTVYANLKDRDYIREPSRVANVLWMVFFFFFNISLLLFLRHSPKKYIVASFVVIPLEFLAGLLVFYFTDYNFDFSRILLVQILLQYIGIPILLINFLRRTDAERIEVQRRVEREKVKMKFSVKVAEAEVLMKIAAKVSHDLRSPIMALQIASEYIKGQVDSEVSSLIKESSARIRHIADDTLKVYRDKNVKNNVPFVNVREVLTELLGSYRQIYPQITFQITEEGFYGAQIPFYSLQRVVSNILNNAIEAGGTEIKIKVSSQDDSVEVSIANNGPQISDEIRKRLFHERATFGKNQGTGLGLYQVRKEIESYSGTVGLDSGNETKFVISLPRELKPFVVDLREHVLVLERNGDLGKALSSVSRIRSYSCSKVIDAVSVLHSSSNVQLLVLVDIAFENGEDTAFDFLELLKDRTNISVLLFSTIVDNNEIQKIADSYRVQLVEKWQLMNAILNFGNNKDNS